MTSIPPNQDNQKINISPPEQKDFLSRNLSRIFGVAVIFIVILGIILIGLGSSGIIPLVAGLVPGLIFVCSPLVVGVSRYLRLTFSEKKLSPMRSDLINYSKNYCLNHRKANHPNDDLKIIDRSTNSIFEHLVDECESEILENIYLEHQDIMKAFLDQSLAASGDRIKMSTVYCFSMYYIIQKMILKREELFNSITTFNAIESLFNRKVTAVDDTIITNTPLPRLCLFFAPWRDYEMTIFRAGVTNFFENYHNLRTLINQEEFYKADTDYYQLRLMFNDLIQKLDEIFDLQKVKEEFPKFISETDPRRGNIANLLYWSFVKDNESGKDIFMNLVKEASKEKDALTNRGSWDLFYS